MAGHTERQWEGKFFRCGMRCFYCHIPLTLVARQGSEPATKDHLTPVSRGGADTIDNIVPACLPCNSRKGDMTDPEFRTAFSKAMQIVTTVASADRSLSLEQRDEPRLQALLRERENLRWWRSA